MKRQTKVNHRLSVEKCSCRQNWGFKLAPGQDHRKPVYWVVGDRRIDGASSSQAFERNCKNSLRDAKGNTQEVMLKGMETKARSEGGWVRSSVDAPVMGAEQRIPVILWDLLHQPVMGGV